MATIYQILANINESIPSLNKLITSASVIIGFCLMLRGVYKLRLYGELRTMMSIQTNLMDPIILLLIGTVLIYWPTILSTTIATIFAYSSPLAYQQSGLGANYDTVITVCGNIIKLIGFFAFVRGWMLVTKYGQQGAQGGSNLTKGIWHILGGTCAINIYGTWSVIKATLGV